MRYITRSMGEVKKKVQLKMLVTIPEISESKKLPLLVHLHGAGERGDHNRALYSSCITLKMPEQFVEKLAIVSPQCPEDSMWDPDSVVYGVNEIVNEYNLDENRIYLTGFSMGGRGTWDVATEYPDMFAALAPISGYSCYLEAKKIAHIPTWIFHGENDNCVPVAESTKMFNELKHHGGSPKMTIFEAMGHGGWDTVYSAPKFYEWLLSKTKNTNKKALMMI